MKSGEPKRKNALKSKGKDSNGLPKRRKNAVAGKKSDSVRKKSDSVRWKSDGVRWKSDSVR